ncbi:hypothetical protein B0H66DRAFT_535765 [Apodospora peruviana]|uniref:BTB domain-containing protein n=1 Tax=Apodospora peruviana TaxID=516989 RepID=A0AAE0HXW2_9PEZI|nr:hypothetical protein B0H66DRAFT_535765 [Apodospora peruviana]
MANSAPPIMTDDRGDLRLVIGPDKREFAVCSRSLSRASTVFKGILHGSSTCPEDDASAAEVLLNIAHARFDDVPRATSLSGLHDIFVFADKYDMTKLLRPWAQSWSPSAEQLQDSSDFLASIGVAAQLGAVDTLSHIARRLVVESRLNATGQLIDAFGLPIKGPDAPLIPDRFFENLSKIRLIFVEKIFGELRAMISRLQNQSGFSLGMTPLDGRHICKHKITPGLTTCYMMTLGCIVAGLSHPELHLVLCKSACSGDKDYLSSVNQLVQAIQCIKVISLPGNDHKRCNPLPGLLLEIQDFMDSQQTLTADQIASLTAKHNILRVVVPDSQKQTTDSKDGNTGKADTPVDPVGFGAINRPTLSGLAERAASPLAAAAPDSQPRRLFGLAPTTSGGVSGSTLFSGPTTETTPSPQPQGLFGSAAPTPASPAPTLTSSIFAKVKAPLACPTSLSVEAVLFPRSRRSSRLRPKGFSGSTAPMSTG